MKHILARNLAAAFLSGSWSLAGFLYRGEQACGRTPRWLRPLARRVLTMFPEPSQCSWETLTTYIAGDFGFYNTGHAFEGFSRRVFWVTPAMRPAPWPVPPLANSTALATWLGLSPQELDWFADCHGREADVPASRLRHYVYRWLPKRSGKWRLLEMPKSRLKNMQRKLLHDILDHLPAHEAAHGFRSGRSIATFTAPHCGQRIVLRFDLKNFFPSVRSSRVHAYFRAAGYPVTVARLLTGLCTNVVPDDVWQQLPGPGLAAAASDQQPYRGSHLPQGAPTSPALANLCAYRLDCRLHGLAQAVGAAYTRYADDLAFSGGEALERAARRFQVQVCLIALEEGFEVHTRKSRFMRQGVRQQLVGVVVNAHPNLRRDEYDRLKAILHNCARHGPASQSRAGHVDFRAHLLGRIAHATMLHAARGERLRIIFDRISWA